jgi:hypothetical protein
MYVSLFAPVKVFDLQSYLDAGSKHYQEELHHSHISDFGIVFQYEFN